jgi:hypothetical protein
MVEASSWRALMERARRTDPRLLMAGLFAVAMAPLMATPILPSIDFYNHLARFFVLAHAASNSLLHANYEIHWSLAPNVAGDALAAPILYFVPPLIAGHLITVEFSPCFTAGCCISTAP